MALDDAPLAPNLAAILDAAGTMMIACDPTGIVRVFNPAAERLLGWKSAEVVGRHTPKLWHDHDEIVQRAAALTEELDRDISADFQVFVAQARTRRNEQREWTFIRKDGTRFPVQLVVSAIRDAAGAICGYLGTAQDISQRVQAEEERERLFNLSLDMLCVASTDGYFKRVNPAFSRILGWSEEELVSRPYVDFVHPDDREATQQDVDKQTDGQPTLTFENRYRCKDGSWRVLSWTSMPHADGSLFATARDVTELRRAEDELRRSRRDLAFTLRSIGDGVIATDAQRCVTRMNPVAEQLTGWQEDEAVGRPIDEVFVIVHETTRQPAMIPVDEVLATGTAKGLANHTLLIARDDREWPIADSAAPIRDDAGNTTGVVLVFRDVSSEREAERALQRLNAELESRVDERTAELATEKRRLSHGNLILKSTASDATLPETLELVVRLVAGGNPAIRCGILLYDEQANRLQLGAYRNLPDGFEEALLECVRGDQVGWIWRAAISGSQVIVEDLAAEAQGGRLLQWVNDGVWRSSWAEPITGDDEQVLGVFVAFGEQIGPPSDDEKSDVQCACGLARFAIERTRSRAELRASEHRHRTLLERIPAPLFVYDRESLAYLAVSDRAVADYGYSRDEFMKMTIADLRPADEVPALKSMLAKSGTLFENRGTWRHQRKDGTIIDVEITTRGFELEGRPACIVLAKDVTEQLRAENALRRSEALNQAILQSSLDCIVTMNEAGEIVEFNRAAEQTFGFVRAQAVGRPVKELMIPMELREQHDRGLAHYLDTGQERIIGRRIRTTALRRGGDVFPIELTVVPVVVDGERLFTAFLRDMTSIVHAEQKLRCTSDLLQAVADGTPDAVFAKDREGRYLLFNAAAANFTGTNADEVLGQNDMFVFGDEAGRAVMENDRLVMQSNQPHTVEDDLTAAGVTRSYHTTKAPLRDHDGNVVGMIGIARDITDRKRVESALRASEMRYRSIVQQSPDVMYVNRDNCITFINQAGVDLLRAASAGEIIGRSPLEFFHPDDHSQIQSRVAQLLSEPGTVPIVEERIVALDGTLVDVEVQAASYCSDEKLEIQVVCRDVTLRKRAERDAQRHVRHAEFNAAVGVSLSQRPTLPEMLQGCAEAMVARLEMAFARIWTFDEDEGILELQASAGVDSRQDGTDARAPIGEKQIGRIAADKFPHLSNSVADDADICDPDWAQAEGLVFFAGYPLLIQDRCVGVAAVFLREPIEQDTQECLAMAANGIAQNIARKHSESLLTKWNAALEQRVGERTRELEESEQFNRATLDALSAHVAVVDRDGNIVAANDAWRRFAAENEACLQSVSEGANYLRVCDAAAEQGDPDAAIVAGALREVLAGQRTAWQHEYPCHSPTEQRWFICQVTLGYIRKQPHAVVAHENITVIKRAQVKLREAKEKAVQASLAKSEFLASMSHELRTPLNGVLGMNAMLLSTDLDDRQRRFAEACESSGKLLTQLINDVLDLSKIEAGKLELDPRQCEIEALVYDVVDILSNAAQQKGLTLSCRLTQSACVSALVDDNRLRQILINLVGNALKFTTSGGVTIVGERIDRAADETRLRIEVTDSGIGIPQERMDRLFKPFSQVDGSTTRQFGGTGLGLSICHQLVELMGGEIGVDSQVGVGSTFWFEIPLTKISQPARAGRRWQSLSGVKGVTLGCSDVHRSQIKECMVNWGCDCVHAESPNEALDIARRFIEDDCTPVAIVGRPAALATDAASLERLVELCEGRVVAITDAHDMASSRRFASLGIREFLPESIRPSGLFEALTSLILPAQSRQFSEVRLDHSPAQMQGHLLVAEDNQINRLYIFELLKMLGCTCDVVENGADVLAALENSQYDLVLMDCLMPEMDGYAAARAIRKRETESMAAERIPIVALTANALKGDRERCLDAGMDDYVKKPVDLDQLQTALANFLQPAQPQPTAPSAL